jgi:hypothetical protein
MNRRAAPREAARIQSLREQAVHAANMNEPLATVNGNVALVSHA